MEYDYAVVKFEDGTVSEIPTNWLNVEHSLCYWPNTKNVSVLMSKKLAPSKDWRSYSIIIETYCDTLEEARRRAENISYTESEESQRGKGKRLKRKTYQTDSQSDESDKGNRTPSPKRKLPRPVLPLPWETNSQSASNENCEIIRIISTTPSTSNRYESPVSSRLSEVLNDSDETQISRRNELSQEVSESPLVSVSQQSCNHDVVLRKILANITEVKLNIKEIHKKLVMGEVDAERRQEILKKIPIKSIEDLRIFDDYYTKTEKEPLLSNFLTSIGGCDAKDHANRILKMMFTNEFAMTCSWLGLRNNIRICDFAVMKVIQNILLKSHRTTLKDIEKVISDWFRHARQRYTREENIS